MRRVIIRLALVQVCTVVILNVPKRESLQFLVYGLSNSHFQSQILFKNVLLVAKKLGLFSSYKGIVHPKFTTMLTNALGTFSHPHNPTYSFMEGTFLPCANTVAMS